MGLRLLILLVVLKFLLFLIEVFVEVSPLVIKKAGTWTK